MRQLHDFPACARNLAQYNVPLRGDPRLASQYMAQYSVPRSQSSLMTEPPEPMHHPHPHPHPHPKKGRKGGKKKKHHHESRSQATTPDSAHAHAPSLFNAYAYHHHHHPPPQFLYPPPPPQAYMPFQPLASFHQSPFL